MPMASGDFIKWYQSKGGVIPTIGFFNHSGRSKFPASGLEDFWPKRASQNSKRLAWKILVKNRQSKFQASGLAVQILNARVGPGFLNVWC